jgi:signal transduction histidine kinase
VSIITSRDIKLYGYRTLADILNSVKSFYVTYDRNYSSVGVRGFGCPEDYNTRILFVVDGHRMNDNLYDMAFIGTDEVLDVDLIDRVEIIRGPGSSRKPRLKNCEVGVYTKDRDSLIQILKSLATDADIAYASVMNRQNHKLASQVFSGSGSALETDFPTYERSALIRYRDISDERDKLQYRDILYPITGSLGNDIPNVLFSKGQNEAMPEIIGYLRLGLPQASLQKRIRQLVLSATLFTACIVLIGTGFTIFLSRRITSPLKRLTAVSRHIAEGRFDSSIDIHTSDELHDLAQAFDHMRGSLSAYREEVEERIAREKRHLWEKEKLLMDLHDGIGGITTNISILSELASKASDPDSIKKKLATISQLSRKGVLEIRSFMQSLDSRELTWNALSAQIRIQGNTMLQPHNITFSAETSIADDVQEQPGSLLWVNLFRIYKESLMNIIKHSSARKAAVMLQVKSDTLRLTVEDDGIGWSDTTGNHGRGFPNMRKRAAEIGGQIFITGLEKKGTKITLHVPFP